MHRFSRRARGALAVTVVATLLALTAAPVSAARPVVSFTFDACFANGSDVQTTMTWSGFTVDEYDFGFGQDTGEGAGFSVPIRPSRTGNESTTWQSLSDTVDLVGGGVSFRGTLLQSAQVHRPAGGWAALPAC